MPSEVEVEIARSFNPQDGIDFDRLFDEMERAREAAPVFYWEPYGMWVVAGHDDVVNILKDPKRFSNQGILSFIDLDSEAEAILLDAGVPTHFDTTWMNLVDGDEHHRMRSSVVRAFTPRQVARLEPTIEKFANDLIGNLPEDPFDLIESFTYPLPIQVILALIDVPNHDMDELRVWSDHLTALSTKSVGRDDQIRWARSAVLFDQYVAELIERRRQEPGDDFLSLLLLDVKEGKSNWSDRELRYLVTHGLILAGHETTKAAISNGVYHILSDPNGWHSLVSQPELIPGVVEEGLRLTPPLVGYFRRATIDVEVAGTTIPKDARVYVLLASANHDARRYECPREFRMDRPASEQFHLTFSLGPHFCLGANLARLEYRVALSVLTQRLPNLKLASTYEAEYEHNMITRHLRSLLLTRT